MSLSFTNTRTRLPYNERGIFNTERSGAVVVQYRKISSSLCGKQVRVFVNKTVSNPFNIQYEFTANNGFAITSHP